ncbi:MAG: T9SS type A sorting domain-containing protein [Flavobacterium sp.]|nr:T9SS type A sorting domain-containing protein [Flavobacterium sp.]
MKKILLLFMYFSINMIMAQPHSYVPTNGLLAWYPFDGNANDESGNNLNGTVNGANLTTDRFNTQNAAYSFAQNQEIYIPNTENLNTYPLTISLWYNASSLEDGMASNIFSKYVAAVWNGFQIVLSDCRNVSNNGETLNNGFGVSSWYLRDNNNKVIGYYGEDPFLQQNISSNVWYHYVFTLNETGGKIYVNGQLIESHPWTGISGASTSLFLWKIGGFYNSWYNGKIDDIGVWNRALTQEEITNLYDSSLPQSACLPEYVPTNGLMGYWPFCGNANDESGNGNNGTVNGATLTTDRFGSINNSYQFIENTDIISIANTTINPQDFTISGWCKLNSPFVYTTFNILEVANIDYTTLGGFGLRMDQNDNFYGQGKYKVYAYAGLSGFGTLSSNSLDLNFTSNWNHFVVTKQNGIMTLYINNQLISSIPFTGQIDFTNAWLQIGNRQNINNNPLSSRNIDDVGIWNRALTQEEITGLYNSTLSTTELTQTNDISIYPNPANDHITIDCGNLANVVGYQIKIVNTLGQEVFSGAMNTQQYVVPLNTWTGTGVYFVKIYDASNNLLNTKKIILQ